ncbi:MAG: cysteine peptidase family C39 domain-containing protein [Bryobacteraceae bacterium]
MRRFFVPEVVQTSAMDCGPACLKCLLEGFGIRTSYGRLREACQTDVDGTSIDQLEIAANQLGLNAEQIMMPVDHLLLPESKALPALVVAQLGGGDTHFVVVWRRHGGWVQVMDPAVGRRWVRAARFLNEVFRHSQPVPAETWREWASGDEFLKPLRSRLSVIGAREREREELIDDARRDPDVLRLARLDAAVRMLASLIQSGAIRRGCTAVRLVQKFVEGPSAIPDEYWSTQPDPREPTNVVIRGGVLLKVNGRNQQGASDDLSPELSAAVKEKTVRPGWLVVRQICADGFGLPIVTFCGIILAAFGLAFEALLFRGLFDVGRDLTLAGQRAAAVAMALVFLIALMLLDLGLAFAITRMGRQLEMRLRSAFLAKIPRLGDRYFQSRPVSDMAERSHNVQRLRHWPELGADFLRAVFELLLTVGAITFFYPGASLPALLVAAVAIGVPLAGQPILTERDLRLRTQAGALMRFYLDALLGLIAVRAHGAQNALRREQQGLLSEWARAGIGLQKTAVAIEGIQYGLASLLVIWLLWTRLQGGGDVGGTLLLVYWTLNLPVLGQDIAAALWQYPWQRNVTLRLLEPIGAPEETVSALATAASKRRRNDGVEIILEGVTVRASGHVILGEVSTHIPAGSHVGIVGPSGAGKSSLVGLLLGWHRSALGKVLVDGAPLDSDHLEMLRRETAWVDPQVQLWNRTLLDNLRYGNGSAFVAALEDVLDEAELRTALRKLPEGLQTILGEGGALVSGGEGQRVRLGRAMARSGVRLAILDEPARGLDRDRRRVVIERARERWREATMLCITHDVSDTRDFERVLVIEHGRLVEDGHPLELAAAANSRYRALLDAEDMVRRGLWASTSWRRLRLEKGKLVEADRRELYARPVR